MSRRDFLKSCDFFCVHFSQTGLAYRSSDEKEKRVWKNCRPVRGGQQRKTQNFFAAVFPKCPFELAKTLFHVVLGVKGKTTKATAEEVGSFVEQDSTAVPKFAFRSFCPCGNLVGECLPQTLLMRLTPLKNPSKYFFGFFKNSSASHPVFLLLVRGHHAQPKGGFYHAKTI